jgi:hypothetical protein
MVSPPDRRHFIHQMKGADPAAGGDLASWFRFYKWDVEGEVFVPRQTGQHLHVRPGDLLWFSLDHNCLGCVVVTQIVLDPLGSGVQEVWYEPSSAWVPRDDLTLSTAGLTLSSDELPSEAAADWLRNCVKRETLKVTGT